MRTHPLMSTPLGNLATRLGRFGAAASVILLSSWAMTQATGGRDAISRPGSAHFADADDTPGVLLGQSVYRNHCAACHGRYLQGQPLWRLADTYAGRRAPALDQSGHAWLRDDEALFAVTKFGGAARSPGSVTSAMPAFQHVLDDRSIVDVIAFLKSRWPIGLRVVQAMGNPASAGLPGGADHADWRFPPECQPMGQRNNRKVRTRPSP